MLNEDLHKRYLEDPVFNHLVKTLQAVIRTGQTTPSELRAALTYALTRMELYEANTSFVYDPEVREVRRKAQDGY